MKEIKQVVFLNGAGETGAGEEIENEQGGSLTVAASGTFVGAVKMQGKLGGAWYDLAVVDAKTLTPAEKITAPGAYSVACVEGFDELRANVAELTSGNVTVVGRLLY